MLNSFTVKDINSVEPLSIQALPPNPLFGPSQIKLTSKKYLESKSDIQDGWLTVLEICLTPHQHETGTKTRQMEDDFITHHLDQSINVTNRLTSANQCHAFCQSAHMLDPKPLYCPTNLHNLLCSSSKIGSVCVCFWCGQRELLLPSSLLLLLLLSGSFFRVLFTSELIQGWL